MDKFQAKEKYFMDKMCEKEKKYSGDCCDISPKVTYEECCPEPCCEESYIVTPPPVNNHTRNDIRKNNNNGNRTIRNCGGNVNFYTKNASDTQGAGIPLNVSFSPNNNTNREGQSIGNGAVPFDPATASSYSAGTLVTYNCEVYVVNRSNPCGVPGSSSDYTKLSNNNTECNCDPCSCGGTSYGFPMSGQFDECCLTTNECSCSSGNFNGMFIEGFNTARSNCYVCGQIISYNGNLYQVNRNSPCGIPGESSDYTQLTNNNCCKNTEKGSISGYFFNRTDFGATIATNASALLKEAANNNTKGFFSLTSPGNITILKGGTYKIQYNIFLENAVNSILGLYRNGTLIEGSEGGTTSTNVLGNTLVSLNKDDVISIRNIGDPVTLADQIDNIIPTVVSLNIEKVTNNC